MSVTYFKRYRMEIDLRHRDFSPACLLPGYKLVPWDVRQHAELTEHHAEVLYQSFHGEIDSGVFSCFSDLAGCQGLLREMTRRDGFVPEATWLVRYEASPTVGEMCGTIQAMQASRHYGAIQNVGVTPFHRNRRVGRALVLAALSGLQQVGLAKAYLEVTARNQPAVDLYEQLGFRRVKTLYKAVDLAHAG